MIEVDFCNDVNSKYYGHFFLRPQGDDFHDIIDVLKENNLMFDPTSKAWICSSRSLGKIKSAIDLDPCIKDKTLSVSELVKYQINQYESQLKELEMAKKRMVYHSELMHFNALPGKHPYENYQMQDFINALSRNRFLFAWDVGLGKSWALTALLEHLRFYNIINKCVLFTSGIGVWNLKSELIKFGKNQKEDEILTITSVTELKKDRGIFSMDNEKYNKYKTIIMTYDTLKAIDDYYYMEMQRKAGKKKPEPRSARSRDKNSYIPWEDWAEGKALCMFLDENHLLGAANTMRTKVFLRNVKYFKYRYEFTGTLADRYEKLYTSCLILDRDLVHGLNYTEWTTTYNQVGNKFSRFAINPDAWDTGEMESLNAKLITSYGSKRLKGECIDLPDHIDAPTIYLDMSDKQRRIYEMFSNESVKKAVEDGKAQGKSTSESLMNKFAYFQLAVDNPECLLSSQGFESFSSSLQELIKEYDYNKDCTKLKALDDIVNYRLEELDDPAPGIIWTYHPATAKALAKRYEKYRPVLIQANLDKDERFAAIKALEEDVKQGDTKRLIIASLMVMNSSLTVTYCNWECYIERVFQFPTWTQAHGRIDRPSQKDTTVSYTFCFNDSIDRLQLENLETKGQTLESLMNRKFISGEAWKKLFNLKKTDRAEELV